jgi:hypothetical protein
MRSWFERLTATGVLFLCVSSVAAGPIWIKAPASAVVAFYAALGLASIWLLYRICRMGVRFDDQGVTFRRVFRKRRWSWPEVSRFADGANVITGHDGSLVHFWAVKMVLRDGRSFMVPGTTRLPWTYGGTSWLPTVLAKIRQVAERYQVPAGLIGRL